MTNAAIVGAWKLTRFVLTHFILSFLFFFTYKGPVYITNNILIFYPKVDESFIISKGTPLVQIVPFVRYPWKSKITYLTKEEINEKLETDIKGDLKEMNQREDVKNEIVEPYYIKKFKTRKEYS